MSMFVDLRHMQNESYLCTFIGQWLFRICYGYGIQVHRNYTGVLTGFGDFLEDRAVLAGMAFGLG